MSPPDDAQMRNAKQIANAKDTPCTTKVDFCRIFEEDMGSLYLLAWLLTVDRQKAEHCFVSGLDDCVRSNHVFKEWARSWARRTIVQNAVRVINPQLLERSILSNSISVNGNATTLLTERVEIPAILELEPFDRFVFVMSVLEGYSDIECAVLLSCARRDVLAARLRARQGLGNALEFQRKQSVARQPRVTDSWWRTRSGFHWSA
jgi:hypothetical protein